MDANAVDSRELAQHRPQLLKYALAQLRERAAAEDAVQDTLAAALEGLAGFARGSSVRTWLIGILKHKIIDQFRRRSREVPLPDGDDEGAQDALDRLFRSDGHLHEAPSDWGDPEAALARREFFTTLESCLELLPKRTAQVFALREMSGLSTAEICGALGISESNCWVMLHRARASLRAALEARWFGAQPPDAEPTAARETPPRRRARSAAPSR